MKEIATSLDFPRMVRASEVFPHHRRWQDLATRWIKSTVSQERTFAPERNRHLGSDRQEFGFGSKWAKASVTPCFSS